MKINEKAFRGVVRVSLAALALLFSCLNRAHSQIPPVKLITLRATVKDTSGHPVYGATIVVTDKNKAIVEDPDLVTRFSGWGGQTDTQVPAVSSFYFVTIRAQGYLIPSPQKVSGLHDANLKFVIQKKPRASRLKNKLKNKTVIR